MYLLVVINDSSGFRKKSRPDVATLVNGSKLVKVVCVLCLSFLLQPQNTFFSSHVMVLFFELKPSVPYLCLLCLCVQQKSTLLSCSRLNRYIAISIIHLKGLLIFWSFLPSRNLEILTLLIRE